MGVDTDSHDIDWDFEFNEEWGETVGTDRDAFAPASDAVLLAVSLVGLLCICVGLYWVVKPGPGEADWEPHRRAEGPGEDRVLQRDGAGGNGLRRRQAGGQAAARDGDEGSDQEGERLVGQGGRDGRRAAAREARRRARAEARRFEQAAREERRNRVDPYAERQDQRALEFEERERQKELEEAEQRAAKEIAEAEEYDQWKGAFAVEEEGSRGASAGDEPSDLLQRFVDYIQRHKVVVLEDLAAEFSLAAPEAVRRVEALERQGCITGVIDDRGKFIHVTPGEMDAVARFIRRRGRVSIAEITRESNRLIHLSSGGSGAPAAGTPGAAPAMASLAVPATETVHQGLEGKEEAAAAAAAAEEEVEEEEEEEEEEEAGGGAGGGGGRAGDGTGGGGGGDGGCAGDA